MYKATVSKQTSRNWWTDAVLMLSALIAGASGIYFLYLPSGGYQGGRNATYNLQILFSRDTWDDLHTWGGLVMVVIAVIHLVIHWQWVASMARRTCQELINQRFIMNARGRWNLILNSVVAVSFLLTALSGIYLWVVPGGRGAVDPLILFTRTTWDLVHTWAGVLLILAAGTHLAIHWRWVTKVTAKMIPRLESARPLPRQNASQEN